MRRPRVETSSSTSSSESRSANVPAPPVAGVSSGALDQYRCANSVDETPMQRSSAECRQRRVRDAGRGVDAAVGSRAGERGRTRCRRDRRRPALRAGGARSTRTPPSDQYRASAVCGPVGATVGTTIGATVSTTVGTTIGPTIGATVGPTIGATVSPTIGATVSRHRQPRHRRHHQRRRRERRAHHRRHRPPDPPPRCPRHRRRHHQRRRRERRAHHRRHRPPDPPIRTHLSSRCRRRSGSWRLSSRDRRRARRAAGG